MQRLGQILYFNSTSINSVHSWWHNRILFQDNPGFHSLKGFCLVKLAYVWEFVEGVQLRLLFTKLGTLWMESISQHNHLVDQTTLLTPTLLPVTVTMINLFWALSCYHLNSSTLGPCLLPWNHAWSLMTTAPTVISCPPPIATLMMLMFSFS